MPAPKHIRVPVSDIIIRGVGAEEKRPPPSKRLKEKGHPALTIRARPTKRPQRTSSDFSIVVLAGRDAGVPEKSGMVAHANQ